MFCLISNDENIFICCKQNSMLNNNKSDENGSKFC